MTNQVNPTDRVETELEYADRTHNIQMFEALDRLHSNEDFQKVILEGYFQNEPVRITGLLATDYIRNSGMRPVLMEQLVAISNLQDYFKTIVNLGSPVQDEDDLDYGHEG